MDELIPRTLEGTLQRLAGPHPVVYLTGPRQSGKTTLARAAFPEFAYVNLEDLQDRASVQEDPRGFLRHAAAEAGVIIDEAQRVPELFSYLQGVVDEGKAGPFVLTGSQQFLLARQVNQSLAGRAAVLQLLPFSMAELSRRPPLTADDWADAVGQGAGAPAAGGQEAGAPAAGGGAQRAPSLALDEVLFTGMYPAIHHRRLEPAVWLDAYVSTYVERDARMVGAVGDLASFMRFVGLCAGRSGQLLNLTSLGNDAGVSRVTASRWLSILSSSYIVALLQPHFENFSRRLVKAPKLFLHHGERAPLYFWRDSNGREVDVIMDLGVRRVPLEAKAGETVAEDAFRGLETYLALSAAAAESMAAEGRPGYATTRGVLVYGGDDWYRRRGHDVRPWWACS